MYNAGNTHDKELHRKETNNMVCTPSEGSEGSDQLKSLQNRTDALAVHVKKRYNALGMQRVKSDGFGHNEG